MFMIREPSDDDVARFIASQRDLPFTYAEVGATNARPPAGYNVDHNRIQLGSGETTYRSAVDALKNWRHFELGWVGIVPRGVPVEVGATVAVQAKSFWLWSLNACRIVYLINEAGGMKSVFVSLMEPSPIMSSVVKKDSPLNGTKTIRFGTTCTPSRDRNTVW